MCGPSVGTIHVLIYLHQRSAPFASGFCDAELTKSSRSVIDSKLDLRHLTASKWPNESRSDRTTLSCNIYSVVLWFDRHRTHKQTALPERWAERLKKAAASLSRRALSQHEFQIVIQLYGCMWVSVSFCKCLMSYKWHCIESKLLHLMISKKWTLCRCAETTYYL